MFWISTTALTLAYMIFQLGSYSVTTTIVIAGLKLSLLMIAALCLALMWQIYGSPKMAAVTE